MFTREALERRSDPVERSIALAAHAGPARRPLRIVAPQAAEPEMAIDRLLRRLAIGRTGADDVAAAFAPPELRRLRTVLGHACAARGQGLRRRRR